MNTLYKIVCFQLFLAAVKEWRSISCLECYVCENQEDNHEKCVSTVQLCDPEIHDVCSTNIRWGVTFYWLPAVKRIHYLSKACDNMQNCMQRKRVLETMCYRDWWADWTCEDCCTGDRCNYYVVLDSPRIRSSSRIVAGFIVVGAVFHLLQGF